MNNILSSVFGISLFALSLVAYFPGGTILMAMRCHSYRLDGWDWVLSVIVPFYGLFKAFVSSAC